MKSFLKAALVFFVCASIFFGCSYFYLNRSLKNAQKPAGETEENIPYYETPENCGLRFFLPGEKEVLFFLDFTEEIAYIIIIDENNGLKGDYAGYTVNYDFTLDYAVLSEFFDRLGGLDLEIEGEPLRVTGVQVCDMLCTNSSKEFSASVIRAVCERIAQEGLTNDDFVFLIENGNTGLTLPVCIYWQNYLEKTLANAMFVN